MYICICTHTLGRFQIAKVSFPVKTAKRTVQNMKEVFDNTEVN